MMKKFLVFSIIFISCGGADVEMIEEPIETIAVSTSTLTPTTTTVTTTSTTTAVPVDYKDTIKEENFFLYFTEYRTTSYADNIFLQLRGYWNEAKSLTIYFNDDCTIFEEINYSRTNKSIGTIAINITDSFEMKEQCKKSSKATSIKVKQVYEGKSADNPYLNFLENGKYFIGKINTTEEEINALCCHDIEFNVINLYISEILNTAITTTTTTTTTTVPKYTFPAVDFPGCPDSYSMTSSIMNLSIDYTITGGDAEIIEFTFENFDTNNGEDFSNRNTYSSEKAAESGIILPKTKGEVVGIQTKFYAQNQNEKRTVKLVVTATDSNGFVGSGECKFIMNPNGEVGQATITTTTLAPTTTTAPPANTCAIWRSASEENRRDMDVVLHEYVQLYIDYNAGNIDLNSFVNSIIEKVNLASNILNKQQELIPDSENNEANSQLKLAFADYALALGFYKKGWAEEDSYYLTMGDIYLDSGDSYIFYYELYREGC